MKRRDVLRGMVGLAALRGLPACARRAPASLAAEDEAFLDDMQRRGCLYFFEQASDTNGQVLDRALARSTTGKRDHRRMASIAATGFGLTALCIADKRGYLPHDSVLERVRRTLMFHRDGLATTHGFFAHFNDVETGKPFGNTEVSPIDTALLLCGVLTARQYFASDKEIVGAATDIYNRVEWPWMLNGGDTFAMGWRDGAFLRGRWNHYCELMMMYLLALGSPMHPIAPRCWQAWSRPEITYAGFEYIGGPDPLFVHQYSHAWFDFRGKRDAYADYFANSIIATRAHEAWCLSLGKPYTPDYWGITASDQPHGYGAWGGPPGEGPVDGSVVPCATAGSLPFLPVDCLRVLRSLKEKFAANAWGRYGFCDAFHPEAKWYDADVLGIDLGIGVLMAENLRTGLVWEIFGSNPEVDLAFERAGFHATQH